MHIIQRRETKYTRAVRQAITQMGHATNAQIASGLRHVFPELSATTVHRITTRLAAGGEVQMAPTAADGSQRFDANTAIHDHFACAGCGRLRDIRVPAQLRLRMQAELGGCIIDGPLLISGNCQQCVHNSNNPHNNKE